MNDVLIKSSNSTIKDNYKILLILIPFTIFKIFTFGIYPVFNSNGDLYLLFKPLILYIIYWIIWYIMSKILRKKTDNYILVISLLISFIITINVPIYIFIISSIIGVIISCLTKNKISSIVVSILITNIYLSIANNHLLDIYVYPFNIIFLILCLISLIYLIVNRMIKIRVFVSYLILLLVAFIKKDTNISFISTLLFIDLFIVCDSRYTPLTYSGMFIYGVILSSIILILKYIINIPYYLFLGLFFGNIFNILINYLSIKLFNNKNIRILLLLFSIVLYILLTIYICKI